MSSTRLLGTLLLSAALVPLACRRDEPRPSAPTPSASASAVASPAASAPAAKPSREPTPAVALTATTPDGIAIAASLIRSNDEGARLVVLAHRSGGTREEWRPLVDKLTHAAPAPHVLTLDLRGHGASNARAAAGGKPGAAFNWYSMPKGEWSAMGKDVVAAVGEVDKLLGARVRSLVYVGSDMGATAVVLAAAAEPRVVALGLVSPGAALHGVDLYHPFAPLRDRAVYLATSEKDTISAEPVGSLAVMAKEAVVKRYSGEEHSAERLGAGQAELWDDLATWILGPASEAEPPLPPLPAGSVPKLATSAPAGHAGAAPKR